MDDMIVIQFKVPRHSGGMKKQKLQNSQRQLSTPPICAMFSHIPIQIITDKGQKEKSSNSRSPIPSQSRVPFTRRHGCQPGEVKSGFKWWSCCGVPHACQPDGQGRAGGSSHHSATLKKGTDTHHPSVSTPAFRSSNQVQR